MSNHAAVAKTVVTAACTLAMALLTIGMGVNSSWAGSDLSAQSTCALADCDCNFRECMADVDTEQEYPGHETVESCKQLYALCEGSDYENRK
jgi:hypothetical protein